MTTSNASLTQGFEMTIQVAGGVVSLRMGAAHAEVPVEQIDAFVHFLHAAKSAASLSVPASTAPKAVPAPARTKARSVRTATRPAAKSTSGKPRRKSRKRVGDALMSWMEDNPGWRTQQELLDAVVTNRMTDANPKRALMIALGKQRGTYFETDTRGRWRLKASGAAADAPEPAAEAAAKPRGRRKQRKAVVTAAPRARGGKRKTRLKTTRKTKATATGEPSGKDEGGPNAKATTPTAKATGDPNKTAAKKAARNKAAANKGPAAKRKSAGRAKKATKKAAAGSESKEPSARASADTVPPAEAASASGRRVLVKKGQDRKSATLPPGELEKRQTAASNLNRHRQQRWKKVSPDALERARKNLLGLGSGNAES